MFRTSALYSSGGLYVNENLATSTLGTRPDADDFNINQEELVNLVLSSGQSLDATGADDEQVARATALVGAGAHASVDSGAVNAYDVAPVRGSMILPTTSYANMDGFLIFFTVTTPNTGASTLDYNGIGAKSVTDRSGDPLTGGEIDETAFFAFNETDDRWEWVFSSAIPTGLLSVTGQAGVVEVTGAASTPHIGIYDEGIDTLQLADEGVTLPKLSDSSTDSLNVVKRLVTAWLNFDMTTSGGTIRDSRNIDSITDGGGGEWSIEFTAEMDNDDYAVMVGCSLDETTGPGSKASGVNAYDLTTTGFKVQGWNGEGTKQDLGLCCCVVMGGLN